MTAASEGCAVNGLPQTYHPVATAPCAAPPPTYASCYADPAGYAEPSCYADPAYYTDPTCYTEPVRYGHVDDANGEGGTEDTLRLSAVTSCTSLTPSRKIGATSPKKHCVTQNCARKQCFCV